MKKSKIINFKDKYAIILGLFFIFLFWFIISFIILPNIEILKTVFFTGDGLSFDNIKKIFASNRAIKGVLNSFLLAIVLPITVSIVGILEVLFIDYFDIKGRKIISICYMVPLVFGGIMFASGYVFTYGSRGMITRILTEIFPNLPIDWFRGFWAVLFIMTFGCTTNYLMFFRNSLQNIDYQTIEAAKGMGASDFLILRKVVLPTLKPMILTCLILLFQTGLMAFSAPLLVGGKDFETISPLILTFSQRPNSRALAAILSLFLGLFQLLLLLVIRRSERKGNFLSVSKAKTQLKRAKINNKVVNIIAHIVAYIFAVINILPLLLVFLFSFTNYSAIARRELDFSSFSLDNYIKILTDSTAYKPFLISVSYSAISAIIAVILMMVTARFVFKSKSKFGALLEFLVHIPWVLPSLMFGLGLLLTYSKPNIMVLNKILTGSLVLMLVAYIVVMLPNTFRFIKASYFSVDSNLEDAARNLGANPIFTYVKVVLPVILPTVLAMLALNFNGKLGDYDLSVFLYNPSAQPVGVVIRNNTNPDIGPEGIAMNFVYTIILTIINALVIFFIYADGKNKITRLFKRGKKNV